MSGQMAPQGEASFAFSTKAVTPERLTPHVTRASLCEQVIASITEWRSRREEIVAEIIERFSPQSLAVRSSAAHEDGHDNSLAGAHLTHIGVDPTPDTITDTIDEVFKSYRETNDGDQVLVQPMVEDVAVSGVVLTHDLDTGSPYYVVNYDDFSGRTDTVTGGAESKTILIRRSKLEALKSRRFQKLLTAVIELETITGTKELNIEFCITETEEIYILQVQPLAARHQWDSISGPEIDCALDHIHGGPFRIHGERIMNSNCSRPNDKPNILFLLVDTLRADRMSLYGYHRPTTPNLDVMAKNDIVCR